MSHTTPTVVVDSGASVIEGAEMNANELADKLEQGHWEGGTREQAATMLRQQKAEYYSLLVNHDKLYAKVVEQQAEIQALKGDGKVCARCGAIAYDPVITQTAKTLTDEEIIEIWSGMETDTGEQNIIFARAILRKAQND